MAVTKLTEMSLIAKQGSRIIELEAANKALNVILERLVGPERVDYNNARIDAFRQEARRGLGKECF